MSKRSLGRCVMKPCPEPPAFSFIGTKDEWQNADRLIYGDGGWIWACLQHAPEAMQRFTELPDGPNQVHADPVNGGTTFALTDDGDQGARYQPVPSPRDPIEPNRADRRRGPARGVPRSHRRSNQRTW